MGKPLTTAHPLMAAPWAQWRAAVWRTSMRRWPPADRPLKTAAGRVWRLRVMIRLAQELLDHADGLALTETLDMGKPLKYARAVDVNSAANCIRWYGEAIDKVYDEIAPTARTALALITREPVGVVGVIVPWNYPLIMAAWKIAPALAAGNSVVLKPSEKSPLTALRLAELALKAGIPAGVFNVVPGYGPEAGSPLALHLDASVSPDASDSLDPSDRRNWNRPQAILTC